MVMYAGKAVEVASTREIFYRPQHPYNRALQKSRPTGDMKGNELYTIPGLPPDLSKPTPGCAFAPRCEFAADACRAGELRLESVAADHFTSCTRVQRKEITL